MEMRQRHVNVVMIGLCSIAIVAAGVPMKRSFRNGRIVGTVVADHKMLIGGPTYRAGWGLICVIDRAMFAGAARLISVLMMQFDE